MADMGRPPAEIDKESVFKLAKLHCTNQEIADFFGVCEKTIRNRFSDIIKLAKANGKMSLRRTQWSHAEKYPGMAQFLGENYLGQSRKQEIDMNAKLSPWEKFQESQSGRAEGGEDDNTVSEP